MSRQSGDEYQAGAVWNGYDYDLQVWVVRGIVRACAHPETMSRPGRPCCNQRRYAGQPVAVIPGHATQEAK